MRKSRSYLAKRKAGAKSLRRDALPRTPLAKEVQWRIKAFGLTQAAAATIVGDAATQVNRLMNGHFHEFSVDRLVKMLLRLGSDVTVTVRHYSLGWRGRCKVKVI